VSVSPTTDSAILDYGESHTFFFTVTNLGTSTVQSGTLTFTVTNDLGEQTDQKTLDFKLQPQLGEETILTVYLYDAEGNATFNLGTYTGSVSIASQETDVYKAASASATVQGGQNSVYLELERKDKETVTILDLILEWLKQNYVAVIVVLAVLGGAAYISRKR